jgi:hypothetical protein
MTLLAASCLAVAVVGLAWTLGGPGGLLYLALYVLATLPGWPIGWALFGRRHAAGWVSGALLGYAFTAWIVWALWSAGLSRSWHLAAAWLAVAAAVWIVAGRARTPLAALPSWRRQDTAGLLLLLVLVPVLLLRPYQRIGEPDTDGARRYRAYFTADFLWHVALTNELTRTSLPPHNPYLADEPLHYYWTYFLVPSAAIVGAPAVAGDDPAPWLKVNATGAGLLFVAVIAVFAWSAAPGAFWPFAATALAVLAASAEGSYLLWRYWTEGRPLDALRDFNVDAATMWLFRGLTIDGLPRSLWYTPQHAGACALGLVALLVAGAGPLRVSSALLAGLALGAAVTFSPFLGGLFAVAYGLSAAALALRRPREWFGQTAVAALAALPVALSIAAALGAGMVEGAGDALHVGWIGHARRAPIITLVLALGPLLVAALAGWAACRSLRRAAIVATVGCGLGVFTFYLLSLPERDPIWVGWRAGQLLLVTLPAVAAHGLSQAWTRSRRRACVAGAVALLFAAGLPTTLLDARNAQDVDNNRPGPGFRWTIPIPREEAAAFRWVRQFTSREAVVQPDPVARGRDTWTHVPTFAARRMFAGQPISLLRGPEYDARSNAAHEIFATTDAIRAARLATDAAIDYLWIGDAERASHPAAALAKFEEHPELFAPVFRNEAVAIYAPHRQPGAHGTSNGTVLGRSGSHQ